LLKRNSDRHKEERLRGGYEKPKKDLTSLATVTSGQVESRSPVHVMGIHIDIVEQKIFDFLDTTLGTRIV